jgi:hypothetical protein
MASYQGHLTVSSIVGTAYGSFGAAGLGLDWGPVFFGAGMTALGGLMPDLDSDSGVPVRELFSLAAAVTPLLMLGRLQSSNLSAEEIIVIAGSTYLLIRYVGAWAFKKLTVHRGMFHSIPAIFIAGLLVFFFYHGHLDHTQYEHSHDLRVRLFIVGGTMLGYLSHLVLDELYAVDFMGVRIKPNKYAGSALKFRSASWPATATTYLLLAGLAYLAWLDLHH